MKRTKQEAINFAVFRLPALSVNEGAARAAVAAFCAQMAPTATELSDIKCAVSEAVTNCVVHAYRERAGHFTVTVLLFPDRRVRIAVRDFCPDRPDELVIGGGCSRNPTLMGLLRQLLPMPVLVNEDLGFDSDAKEAVAFAVLANECVHGIPNNVPSVTGARHPVVMGKISL